MRARLRRARLLLAALISITLAVPIVPPPVPAPAYVRAAADSCVGCRQHGMGLALPAGALHASPAGHAAYRTPAGLPPSVDLSRYDPPVGDQGNVGSCVAWSEGYNLRGWYANRDGYYPQTPSAARLAGYSGYSAMSAYYHITQDYDHGQDGGATLEQGLDVQVKYGLDTRADYQPQADFDYSTPPTAAESANALQNRLPGYRTLFSTEQLGDGAQGIAAAQQALASGVPVVLGLAVYSNFEQASATNWLVGPASGFVLGGHAIMAVGYNADGIEIENQWGTSFGRAGYAVLSYAYLQQALFDVVSISPSAPQPSPTATSTPVPPTVTATMPIGPTVVVSPTATLTPIPVPTVIPWPHPQAPRLPDALPPGRYRVFMAIYDSQGRRRASTVVTVTKR